MQAIPVRLEPEVYKAADFINSSFVRITPNEHFEVAMQYPVLGMTNAVTECYVRSEVYDKLVVAAGLLPKGYKLKILDAWRPFALQEELFYMYKDVIIKNLHLEDKSEEEINAVVYGFVSYPEADTCLPPVHTTGGAVDLTIIDSDGTELNMGTAFDAFTDKTKTDYYEQDGDIIIRDNRRLLYEVMVSAGFTNLPSEWWHYDYGDRFWAFYNDTPAIYKGVFKLEELNGEERDGKSI